MFIAAATAVLALIVALVAVWIGTRASLQDASDLTIIVAAVGVVAGGVIALLRKPSALHEDEEGQDPLSDWLR